MIIKIPPKMIGQGFQKYLEVDLWNWLKDISTAFLKLNFQDNFETFIVRDLNIGTGAEASIPNGFRGRYEGVIPTGYMVVRRTGGNEIVDGEAPWTKDLVSLKNIGTTDVTITVIFFR